jgi:SAM-dependent methyltransferase
VDQRDTFNAVAELYGAARPGYPDALVDDVVAFAHLKSGDAILDVGCGAGQATASFANRGFRIVALDPGSALIRVAQERLASVADIECVTSTFEAWQRAAQTFRLVFAAQSWHWIPPGIAFAKAADLLVDDGALAVFGHVPMSPPEPLRTALEQIYRQHTGAWGPPPEAAYLATGPFAGLFEQSGLFEPVVHKSYAWSWKLTSAGYVAFAETRSDHQLLAPEIRDPLLANVKAAIDALGGRFEWRYETHLYMARLRTGSPAG